MNKVNKVAQWVYTAGCAAQASAKIMAKDLVRSRKHITKFYQMQTHLKGVSLKLAVRFKHCPPRPSSYSPSLHGTKYPNASHHDACSGLVRTLAAIPPWSLRDTASSFSASVYSERVA